MAGVRDPARRHGHRTWGKGAGARQPFGTARQGSVFPLALPCAEVAAHRGSRSWQGMGWAVGKLPTGTVGLEVSCHSPFWGALQLQPHSWDASAF